MKSTVSVAFIHPIIYISISSSQEFPGFSRNRIDSARFSTISSEMIRNQIVFRRFRKNQPKFWRWRWNSMRFRKSIDHTKTIRRRAFLFFTKYTPPPIGQKLNEKRSTLIFNKNFVIIIIEKEIKQMLFLKNKFWKGYNYGFWILVGYVLALIDAVQRRPFTNAGIGFAAQSY